MRLAAWISILAISSIAGAGCAHVNPWEREPLGRIQRSNDSSSVRRHYDAHFWGVRGGMAGGTGEPGGGCGCN